MAGQSGGRVIWAVMVMVVLGLSLLVQSAICAEEPAKDYPVLKGVSRIKASAVALSHISKESLVTAISDLKTKPSETTFQAVADLFCPYAELPEGYPEILADYLRGVGIEIGSYRSEEHYEIRLQQLQSINLSVVSQTRIISSVRAGHFKNGKSGLGARKTLDDDSLRQAFVSYCRLKQIGLGGMLLVTYHFGNDTVVFTLENGCIQPVLTEGIWYADRKSGQISEQGLTSAAFICDREIPPLTTEEDFPRYLQSFLSLWHLEKVAMISGISDIPDYERNPLDEDVASIIRPFFARKDQQGMNVIVSYGYQQVAGMVFRYRFVFAEEGRLQEVDCIRIGKGIGAALWRL